MKTRIWCCVTDPEVARGYTQKNLVHGNFVPVCNPRYRDGHLTHSAQDLLGCALPHHPSLTWEEWFKSVGVKMETSLRGSQFNDYSLALRTRTRTRTDALWTGGQGRFVE